MVVICSTWLLKTECGFSARALGALYHWAIFSVLVLTFYFVTLSVLLEIQIKESIGCRKESTFCENSEISESGRLFLRILEFCTIRALFGRYISMDGCIIKRSEDWVCVWEPKVSLWADHWIKEVCCFFNSGFLHSGTNALDREHMPGPVGFVL